MAELEIAADGGDLCGECPVWDAKTRSLYWTDIERQLFFRYDHQSGSHETLKQGLQINGFRRNAAGGFVITNSGGIWLWDGAEGLRLIADKSDGARCQMNDCVADGRGRLLSGSCFYSGNESYELGKLLQVGNHGEVIILDEGFHLSNGLGFSPDGRSLYFTDSAARRIFVYDYDQARGAVSRRRVLVEVPATEGLPDGLAVDGEGYIWSAQWYGGCVIRYDPDGCVERRLPVPAKQTTSIAFGGDHLTDIFITTAARPGPLPIMPPDYDPYSGDIGGRLYRTDLGIRGKPEFQADISLPA